jgi:thiol-disulfide isomerase/thioredoxin
MGCGSTNEADGFSASGDGTIQQIAITDRGQVDDFAGGLLDGSQFGFDSLEGKVAVFNVWGSWCVPCRKEAPGLREVALAYQPKGVTFVGLNVRDNDGAARAFEREFSVPYQSIRSADSGRAVLSFAGKISMNAIPTTVVLDRQGRVASRVLGAVSAGTLRGLLDDVLAEPAR